MPNLAEQLKMMKAQLTADYNFIKQCMVTDPEANAPVTKHALQEYRKLERQIKEFELELEQQNRKVNSELRTKLEAAMRQVSQKFPAFNEVQSLKQTRARMDKIKGEFPAIRKTFTDDELAQLRKRYEEIEPKLPPTASRADNQSDVESQPYEHAYELYFLTHLLR